MDENGIVTEEYNEWCIDSNEAVKFSLVRSTQDFMKEEFFKPEMTHQIYGDGEQIYGYKDLSVQMFITAGRLNMYVRVTHSAEKQVNKPGEMEPDDIVGPLSTLVPPNTLLDNSDTFLSLLKKEASFRPFGQMLQRHVTKDGRTFEIYFTSEATPGFVDYFERAQMFTMFYVDAASYIDLDDPRWKFFLIFEKYQNPEGNSLYAFAGFTTIYEFYGFPEHLRPRISQMLVLPPFQRKGLGTAMLQAIYEKYTTDPQSLTIAVEDPSQVFSDMRLTLDCQRCLELPEFAPNKLKGEITKEQYDVAKNKLKINKEHLRKVFNVLKLRITDRKNPKEFRSYRLFIKNQLYSHFRRQDKQAEKLKRCNVPQQEIHETLAFVPKEKRTEIINEEYLSLEHKLMEIVNKLPYYDPKKTSSK